MTGRALVTVLALASATLVACGSQGGAQVRASVPTSAPASTPTGVVVFTLEGDAEDGADLTYGVGSDGTEQQQGVDVPMAPLSYSDVPPGAFLYFSAQNEGAGELTCTITVDGKVVSTHTSTGDYAIVTCEGQA